MLVRPLDWLLAIPGAFVLWVGCANYCAEFAMFHGLPMLLRLHKDKGVEEKNVPLKITG